MSKLIDLDAAINALGTIDCSDGVGISTLKCDAVDDAITVIKELPTVDAVPVVHGRWETVEDWDGDERYKCSVCGDEWFLEVGNPEFNNMNYCPKCGARMDGEDGEQE